MDYLELVRDFVVKNFLFGDDAQLQDNVSFLDSGIIDSTGILELITFLEDKFGISVQDDELVPENLDTLQNIARFVDAKIEGHSTPEA